MDDNEPFNFNILDNPTENLPNLDQVPEFNHLTNDFEPFSFDPQPSPNPQLEAPFPVQVVDHEQNTVVVDANSGGMLHNGNDLPDDLAMLNADGLIRDLPNSQPPLEHTQSPTLHSHSEQQQVHMVQPAQVEEVAPPPRRTPAKRKRRSKKTDDNKSAQNHTTAIPTMLHTTSVRVENSTDPNIIPTQMGVHHTHDMAAIAQPNGHVEMHSPNANIPPSQVNVTHVSHLTGPMGPAPAPQVTADTPVNQVTATQAMPPQAQSQQPQQSATNLNGQLIPPTSPLGSLPVHLQDLLMNQARHRSYTVAEVRAADMAQNAAVRIHSMIQTGEIVLNVSTPNTPRFIIPPRQVQHPASHPNTPRGNVPLQEIQPAGTQPPPKVRRTRSKTSSRAQSMRTPPRPSPTPQAVAVHPQTPAIGTRVVAPPSVPSTPVFSHVTRLPSQDLSYVSSADFQPKHLAVPHHPLTPVPTSHLEHLGGMQEPNVQGQASSAELHPQQPVGSTHLEAPPPAPQHPVTPVPPRVMEEVGDPNAQRQGSSSSPVHPKTPVSSMHPKRPVSTKDSKQPVSRPHPKQPVSRKHPKRPVSPKKRKRQAPKHPNRPVPPAQVHYYPPEMMDPTANLSPGAGPSHIPVTARSAHIADVAAQAMSATFHEMEMKQTCNASAAPDATAASGGGSNMAGPSNASYEQLLEANGFPVAPVPQHPGYPQPQASVPPAVIAAHRRAKNTYGVKLRFSRNAKPSKYCHICGRSSLTVRITDCANLKIGLCRKVLCEKCLIIYDPFYYDWSQTEDPRWLCLHCRRYCPDNARCATYTKNNQKRKERNEEKKRQKKKQKLLEDQQKELKRRNDDRRDDPGDSPTGIADNNVF